MSKKEKRQNPRRARSDKLLRIGALVITPIAVYSLFSLADLVVREMGEGMLGTFMKAVATGAAAAMAVIIAFSLGVFVFRRNLFGGKKRISQPPGSRLLAIAEFIYSKKVFERLFEPIIADMRYEYFNALRDGRIWKARMIRVRGVWTFMLTVGLHTLLEKLWKAIRTG